MGFDSNAIKLLIHAKKKGVDFSNTITIGRQKVFMQKNMFLTMLQKNGYSREQAIAIEKDGPFVEKFLESLGAHSIESIDASDYEKADHIHDMNNPLNPSFNNKYSLVIDAGTLEHVFNFPVAIRNCMEMVRKDGHIICHTPTNNFMGHGFYQFSPELFYRILNKKNGFEIIKMYFHTNNEDANLYEVVDPMQVKSRVRMCNTEPSFLFIIAKRIEIKEIFSTTPQQSDYEEISWKTNPVENKIKYKTSSLKHSVKIVIKYIKLKINRIKVFKETGISKPGYFKKIEL